MFEGDNVTTHVNKFCNLMDELAITSISISDNDRVTNLLASMPESYASVIMVQTGNIGILIDTIKL
jgi:hypothetical protein